MSTDHFAVCYTCKTSMDQCIASGSGFYGFKVWDEGLTEFREWLQGPLVDGRAPAVGAHEGHDVRIVSEHHLPDWSDV